MHYHGEIPEFRARYRYLVVVVVATFLILVARLWQLQVVRGDYYGQLAESNFIQDVRVPTVRGRIFDRRKRLLVNNRPSFDVYATPRFVKPQSFDRLELELQLRPEEAQRIRRRILHAQGKRRYQQVLVTRDISRDQLARLETHRADLRGITVMAVAHRHYVHGNLGAHFLGYMNEVSAAEINKDGGKRYQLGDLVGRFGVERMYEPHLRGVHGRERIVVDASGQRKTDSATRKLLLGQRKLPPRAGHDLVLTVDLDLQRLVERALSRYPSGAAIVLEVNTGRVLATASRPSFDPNVLTGRLTAAEQHRLLSDPHRPLLDKVLREHYFPGSTFKVVTAVAGLEEGLVDWEEKMLCKRFFLKYRKAKRCSHAHGPTGMRRSIVESCNIYYYNLSERVGLDTLARYARLFGLGASTGLGLNSEVAGRVPTKAWYRSRKRRFMVGDTLNASIGQGDVKATPIQLANLYAALANGGKLYLPQIVERIVADDTVVQKFAPRLRRQIRLKPTTIAGIQDALRGVVDDRDGTGHEARIEGSVSVSGKTGTAQVARRRRRGSSTDFRLKDHAWFVAYAPSEAPEIVVAVLIAHGGRAAKVAAPVAMRIIDGYFRFVKPFYRKAGSGSGHSSEMKLVGPQNRRGAK